MKKIIIIMLILLMMLSGCSEPVRVKIERTPFEKCVSQCRGGWGQDASECVKECSFIFDLVKKGVVE